jgi:hypothetical protein
MKCSEKPAAPKNKRCGTCMRLPDNCVCGGVEREEEKVYQKEKMKIWESTLKQVNTSTLNIWMDGLKEEAQARRANARK